MAADVTFEKIWSDWVQPLAGQEIHGFNGLSNKILRVDGGGITRVSRNGLISRISIDPFRWTIQRLLAGAAVERKEINEAFPHRYSSGVLLVLEQVRIFEVSGRPAAIRLRNAPSVSVG